MKQRWTPQFEHLGRIREGLVRIAPLMLFTGDNNAGKSEVMALLCSVIALGRDLFSRVTTREHVYHQLDRATVLHLRIA